MSGLALNDFTPHGSDKDPITEREVRKKNISVLLDQFQPWQTSLEQTEPDETREDELLDLCVSGLSSFTNSFASFFYLLEQFKDFCIALPLYF